MGTWHYFTSIPTLWLWGIIVLGKHWYFNSLSNRLLSSHEHVLLTWYSLFISLLVFSKRSKLIFLWVFQSRKCCFRYSVWWKYGCKWIIAFHLYALTIEIDKWASFYNRIKYTKLVIGIHMHTYLFDIEFFLLWRKNISWNFNFAAQDYFQTTYKFLELSPHALIPMHGRVNMWPKHMLCGYLRCDIWNAFGLYNYFITDLQNQYSLLTVYASLFHTASYG